MFFKGTILPGTAGSLRSTFVRAFAWNHAAKVTEYFLLYIFSVLVARNLGPENNGVYATVVSMAQFLLIIASAGFDHALNKYLPGYFQTGNESNIRSLFQQLLRYRSVLLVLLCGMLTFAWPAIRGWINLHSAPTQYLMFIVVLGSSRSLTSLLSSVWISQFRSKIPFIINTSIPLFQIAALLSVGNHPLLLTDAFTIVVLGAVLSTGISLFTARSYLKPTDQKVELKPVLRFSKWLWLYTIMLYILGKQGDILMLSFFAMPKSTVGIYDVAFTFSHLPGFFLAAGMGGFSMAMFSRVAGENPSGIAAFWTQVTRIFTRVMIPLYCFLFVFAKDLLLLVYSSAYQNAAGILQIFVASRIAARLFCGGENFDALIAIHKEQAAVLVYLAGGILNLLMSIILIINFGAAGAAIATGAATVFNDCATRFLLKKHAGASLQAAVWVPSLIIGLAPVLIVRTFFASPNILQLSLQFILCILLWTGGILWQNQLRILKPGEFSIV